MLNLSKSQIKEVETTISEFIWSGKRPKIALNTLKCDKPHGGLHLVDISAKQDALKIVWIFKLQDNRLLQECAFESLSPDLQDTIWRCNVNSGDIVKLFENSFWRETLLAWSKLNFYDPERRYLILDQVIWYNSWIKINGRCPIWKSWVRQNILTIADIWNEEGNKFKTSQELNVNWLDLYNIISAIPTNWKQLLQGTMEDNPLSRSQNRYQEMYNAKNVSRIAYNALMVYGWNVDH